jgi:effector-binding domain-containing protein
MDNTFEIIETPEQPTLAIRSIQSVEDLPREIGRAYSQIIAYLGEVGGQPADAPFITYYNMDTQALDVEIGYPVNGQIPGRGEITAGVIPAGRKAVGIHQGPYQELRGMYDAMTAWMDERGHQPTGVVYESYLNSPLEVPESKLLTRLTFLLH